MSKESLMQETARAIPEVAEKHKVKITVRPAKYKEATVVVTVETGHYNPETKKIAEHDYDITQAPGCETYDIYSPMHGFFGKALPSIMGVLNLAVEVSEISNDTTKLTLDISKQMQERIARRGEIDASYKKRLTAAVQRAGKVERLAEAARGLR